jgi:hypothetical protein
MKNITMKGWEVLNLMRRTDKCSESSIELAAHTQILKQQKDLMAGITTYLLILTLNVNRFNSPIKRYHLAKGIKKKDLTICYLLETHFIERNKHWIRVKGWMLIYQANGP